MRPEGVSYVVCCHDSRGRLGPTLEHLARQQIAAPAREVVLVDNASRDGTAEFATSRWSGGSGFPLRVVREERLGLNAARVRGIEASRYEHLVFVDDDNWLADDYGRRVDELFVREPEAALLGGCAEASFEGEKPAWFDGFWDTYAVGPQALSEGQVSDARGYVYGAGMGLRHSAWRRLSDAGFRFLGQDRTGADLAGGGDNELGMAVRLAGYRVHYSPQLRLKHRMSSTRLQWSYLLALAKGSSTSSVVDRCYRIVVNRRAATRSSCMMHYRLDLLRTVLAVLKRPVATARFLTGSLAEGEATAVSMTRLLWFLHAGWLCRGEARATWFPQLLRLRASLATDSARRA